MQFEEGWMKRQMEYTYAQTAKWPDWMKKEAGIHQPRPGSTTTPHTMDATKSSKDPNAPVKTCSA
ncbi:MAG: hypothetical protein ACLQVD_22475 [Capsulimonadaceae bacterium]